MTVTPTEGDLRRLMAGVVRREVGPMTPDASLQDTLSVDSIDVLDILAAAEQRYGVYITEEQMVELRRYEDLLRLLGIEAGEPVS